MKYYRISYCTKYKLNKTAARWSPELKLMFLQIKNWKNTLLARHQLSICLHQVIMILASQVHN